MRNSLRAAFQIVLAGVCVALAAAAESLPVSDTAASGPSSATWPAETSGDAIRRLVAELGHPVPSRRQAARRKLVGYGLRAGDELRRASNGPNLEAALQARDLLEELDSAFFQGGQISLEADRSAVNWDEPFALAVVVRNPTPGPIRVTWAAPATSPADQPESEDVRQVAALFDVADFLVVRGPDEQEIDMRTDPLERDPAVRAVVDLRARGSPPSHLVEAGGTARLRIPDFNRGWARYPMLEAGKYRISIRYQPSWKEQQWIEEGVGLAESPPIEVEVRQAAPRSIREANLGMGLELAWAGDDLVVNLRNLWDRPQWVNLDFGNDMESQARLSWQVERKSLFGGGQAEVSPRLTFPNRKDRLPRLAPDEVTEICRVTLDDLKEAMRQAGRRQAGRYELTVRYQFISDIESYRRVLAARKSKTPIPTHVYTGVVTANDSITLQNEGK